MANPSAPIPELQDRPNQDGRNREIRKNRRPMPGAGGESRDVELDLAEADKQARTGKSDEQVRNTAPFGDYDDLKR